MGITAERVAEKWKVNREAQDNFALESHRKAIKAIETGEFVHEISPYHVSETIPDLVNRAVSRKQREVTVDEGPRRDTSLEVLVKLRPAFAAKGSVTAGNSSQTSDGAGAVILVSEKILKQFNLKPLARFVSYAVAGVPPEIMGIGPIKAIPRVLKQSGIKQDDLDWIELNEAFAAQGLAVLRQLDIADNDPRVNPNGGAIALGHPLGASGARLVTTAINQLHASGGKRALCTMCIGVGQGIALVVERV
jgi:acetyl-CoA acyltransferase